MKIKPPRHIVWSTETIDLDDPFQRRWFLKQVLPHGLAKDIRQLDLREVAAELDHLSLPRDIHALWKTYLQEIGYVERDGATE